MRTIKFRVWDIKYKDWMKDDCIGIDATGQILTYRQGGMIGSCWIQDENKDFIIQQFIGLLDKNNKEIYEGDLVNVTLRAMGAVAVSKDESPDIRLGYIFYEENTCAFRVQLKANQYCIFGGGDLEVIGNVFENQELLKN